MSRWLLVLLAYAIVSACPAHARAQALQKVGPAKRPADEQSDQGGADSKKSGQAKRVIVKQEVIEEVDPNLLQFEQQYKQHFQPLLRGELVFIRMVCKPTKEQYQQLAAAGDQAFKETVRKFAEVQNKMMRGGFRPGEDRFPDPRKLIADALKQSVTATLSTDQAKRYEEELAKRVAHRNRVTLLNIVAKCDRELVLSTEQRHKLAESLSSHWDDSWAQSLDMSQSGDQYLPRVPDDLIVPILNDSQKAVWRSTPRNTNFIVGWAGVGFMGGVQVPLEDDWDAKPADSAKPEEEAGEKK